MCGYDTVSDMSTSPPTVRAVFVVGLSECRVVAATAPFPPVPESRSQTGRFVADRPELVLLTLLLRETTSACCDVTL